jgi:hypothetical protein
MARSRPTDDDELFAGPPADFVAARRRLVARLRQDGRAGEARALARRRKPTVALWAANQAARRAPAVVTRLLHAVDRVKTAQLAGRPELRDAMEAQRTSLEELVGAARQAIGAAGLRVTQEILGRVSATILGAAIDTEGRVDLRAGRLLQERSAPGFEAFGDAVDTTRARPARPSRARATPRPRADQTREPRSAPRAPVVALDAAIRAREARQRAEAERDDRVRHAAELETTAERRDADVRAAAQALGSAERQVRDARARLAEARRTAAVARRAARRARKHAEQAARKLSGRRARDR